MCDPEKHCWMHPIIYAGERILIDEVQNTKEENK